MPLRFCQRPAGLKLLFVGNGPWQRQRVGGAHLDVKGGEVVEQFPLLTDLWLRASWTHQVCDVLLFHRDGEVLREAFRADGALAGCEGLHLAGERSGGSRSVPKGCIWASGRDTRYLRLHAPFYTLAY